MKETNDEIPNLGFSLSNKKLLDTGFDFLYNLDQNIKEMIQKWSKQDLIKDLEFVRDGENVIIEANITYPNAVLGGKIEIPTLDGRADLKIPAGIQSNQVLRMKRKGFPVLRGGHVGDQLVKIQVQTPINFSRETKKIIEELDKSLNKIKKPFSKIPCFLDSFLGYPRLL